MARTVKFVKFKGRIVIVGFGSIGQGILPLILRHIDAKPAQITIVTAEDRGQKEAKDLGVRFVVEPLTEQNYRSVLEPLIGAGDFLLNVSVEVSSAALVAFCRDQGALYLDTCIEPWPGGYTDPSLTPSQRSNYALRESALALAPKFAGGPTAANDAFLLQPSQTSRGPWYIRSRASRPAGTGTSWAPKRLTAAARQTSSTIRVRIAWWPPTAS